MKKHAGWWAVLAAAWMGVVISGWVVAARQGSRTQHAMVVADLRQQEINRLSEKIWGRPRMAGPGRFVARGPLAVARRRALAGEGGGMRPPVQGSMKGDTHEE